MYRITLQRDSVTSYESFVLKVFRVVKVFKDYGRSPLLRSKIDMELGKTPKFDTLYTRSNSLCQLNIFDWVSSRLVSRMV